MTSIVVPSFVNYHGLEEFDSMDENDAEGEAQRSGDRRREHQLVLRRGGGILKARRDNKFEVASSQGPTACQQRRRATRPAHGC